MKKTAAGILVAGAMVATLAMFGCGGQQASSSSGSSSAAQSTSQQQTSADTKADSSSSASSSSSSTSATPTSTAQQPATQISSENAKQIALQDAGLTEADVVELRAELDSDDAVAHYDVEFKAKGMEYDYDIDASSGAVLHRSSEVND